MHRKRIKIGRRIFDLWVYATFTAGIIAEVCSIGYLLIHYYTITIEG